MTEPHSRNSALEEAAIAAETFVFVNMNFVVTEDETKIAKSAAKSIARRIRSLKS